MKTAIITGASSGLGRSFVEILAKNPRYFGEAVAIEEFWLLGRNAEALQSLADELQSRGVEVDRLPPMGCIVDMPSAALLAGELIAHGAQILAIDIEDLARYTLGLVKDPAAAARRAASPAVQRLVKEVLRQAEGTSVRVYLCGITVASVDQMPAYLHLGVHHFAAEPAALLPLKKRLMEEDLSKK